MLDDLILDATGCEEASNVLTGVWGGVKIVEGSKDPQSGGNHSEGVVKR